ncbi:glycosyltransferase [Paraburkholderia bryophila]|uniref:Glycosyltransferase involved in cell wall biosynthesis n=1 Tax=Paraburkholderia bryophila TaxID=420952 RepID=A0A7Y9WJZ1_9BURK|nr:glycosyltransferase [Paraburkholderia bryophila]NYH22319.1 glycosyltransferase involved in cell wall biosynthesis [Paraburkholderia bryophila]
MKVETVIRDTQWFAESVKMQPEVSVLLYVGNRDTLELRRAVESVLAQTLTAIQLIVIDDSFDEKVSLWLAEAQESHPQIGVLRHSYVIGLPAVGWVEAIQHARAPWIVLARESDVLNQDALAKLHQEARREPGSICFGYIEIVERDESGAIQFSGRHAQRGKSMIDLRVSNFIGRNAVLIPRHAIDVVGFVDPHVLMERSAEWDLWRRLSERFEMKSIDLAIGTGGADTLQDETVGLDLWAIEERMRTPRNDLLKLACIGEYDIDALDPAHGWPTREVCLDLSSRRGLPGRTLSDTRPLVDASVEDDGYLLVVNVQYDASTALYFDMLPPPFAYRIRVVSNTSTPSPDALARATAVVVSRAVRSCQAWIDAARDLGIPAYYFLDDNMPLLVETGEAGMAGEDFRLDALRDTLEEFDGILLSSLPLMEYFQEHKLHPRLLHFPIVCAAQKHLSEQFQAGREPKDPDEIVFAFMGGLHRSQAVWDLILPALAQIASEGKRIHFIAPVMKSDSKLIDALPASVRVTLLPWDPGYAFALRRFAQMSPDYVLLAPSKTTNNKYKTRHPLLTANLVGAVAVLPSIEPYVDVADGSVALMVDQPFEREGWYRVLHRIVEGHVDVEGMKERNRIYCEREFSGEINVRVLHDVMAEGGGIPSWPLQYRRLNTFSASRASSGAALNRDADESWASSAHELSALRHMRRYSWRHRVLSRPSDLWDHCSPAFWALQRDALKHGWRRPGGTLEFSDDLHALQVREYEVMLPVGTLDGMAFALVVDGPRRGKITVELLSDSGELAAHATRELSRIDLTRPVRFMFDPVEIPTGSRWRVRLRCYASVPVYVYEMVNRRKFGTSYSLPTPFMELLFGDKNPAAISARAQGSVDSPPADSEAFVKVKLVIEGDIPTNQIIERLLVEAIGTRGQVRKLLLAEFTPDTLLDGGIVIMSRTASPASLPMIEWMKAYGVPFVYYIDDNFWELAGDTPLAQFYRSAPVRRTLDRSINDAKAVIVNAPLLGEYIKDRYPEASISFLNAPFDFSLLEGLPRAAKSEHEVRIGFAGSITRADDFVEILPALTRLRDTYGNVTLTFFGYCPPELINSERVTYVPHVANYSEFIRLKASHSLDIGLAPMAASAANLYKTNNKYREYGAMKIAGIYTDTSPYKECVMDGETGLLVNHSIEAWYEALEKLVTDVDLRARIATAAYEDVKTNYAQSVVAQQWGVFLRSYARQYRTSTPGKSAHPVAIVRIRARRWLGQTRIRVLVRIARIRSRVVGLAHRMHGERGQ